MKKLKLIFLFALCFTSICGAQNNKSGGEVLWKKITESLIKASSYSFYYSSGDITGLVAISKDALYLSQGDIMEIFETKNVRYSYYSKRNKLDIDPIGGEGSSAYALFGWIEKIEHYNIPSIVNPTSKNPYYTFTITGKDSNEEEIAIRVNNKGEIFFIGYKSKKVKYIEVSISNIKYNDVKPYHYFTFDPAKRSDLEVTDYR